MFENLREDWNTYERDIARQGLWVMVVYRFGRWRYGVHPAFLRRFFSFIYRLLKVVSQILTGVDIPCETVVGRRFPDRPLWRNRDQRRHRDWRRRDR